MISAPKDIFSTEFFDTMVHELTLARVSKLLGVDERTIRRWIRTGTAPRTAYLAIFWESRWGRSIIDTDHHNEMQLMTQRLRILEGQVVKAKDIITGLRRMQYGTANEPLFDELRDFDHATAEAPAKAQIG